MRAIFPDKNVGHVAQRRGAAVLAGAVAALALGAGAASAQSGGTEPPPSTEPQPAPTYPTSGPRWVFPIPGPHTYGDGFGAARGGRSHQGQDIFAPCGSTMVSAARGPVQFRGFHSRAGHYLVARDKKTRRSLVYMHLAGPPLVGKRQKLVTGQEIGYVGQSGNARGCHLHFEIWKRGWYRRGGKPIDPLPTLQAWDAYS